VRPKTIKILEKNMDSNFLTLADATFFLGMFPEAMETKAKINYWDYI